MRGVILSLLLLPGAVWADPRGDAVALVEAAIQARGGQAGLTKAASFQRSAVGVLVAAGKQEFLDTVNGRLPDRLRIVVELDKRLKITMTVNEKTGWKALNNDATTLPADRLEEFREEAYVLWLTTLVPVLGEGFTLMPVAEAARDGKACVGVKVASRGHFPATLWFDKETKLLVAIEKDSKEAGITIAKTYLYGDYKEFSGVRMPTRIVESIAGRTISEMTIKDYRFPDKQDDALFGKP